MENGMDKLNIAFLGIIYEDVCASSKALFDKLSAEKNVIILNLVDYIEYSNNYKIEDYIKHFGDLHYFKTEYKALQDIGSFDGTILETTPTLIFEDKNLLTLKENYFIVSLLYGSDTLKEKLNGSKFLLMDYAKKSLSDGFDLNGTLKRFSDITIEADNKSFSQIADEVYYYVKGIKGYRDNV